eukprot:EG_transcript_30610
MTPLCSLLHPPSNFDAPCLAALGLYNSEKLLTFPSYEPLCSKGLLATGESQSFASIPSRIRSHWRMEVSVHHIGFAPCLMIVSSVSTEPSGASGAHLMDAHATLQTISPLQAPGSV